MDTPSPQASACRALEAEFQELHGPLPAEHLALRDVEERLASLRALTHRLPHHEQPMALCLSGGGIRSATFGLGVLQGLTEAGLLSRFHFLSTVSGGGYIGALLSSWVARESRRKPQAPLDGVLRAGLLAGGAHGMNGARGAEPRPVRQLRAYSNFLAPMRGISGDTLALVGTFLRNLVLHWAVVIPLLLAVLVLPRLYLSALRAEPGAPGFYGAVALAVALLAGAIAYAASDLPPRHPRTGPRNRFMALCGLPLLGAAILLSWAGAWMPDVLKGVKPPCAWLMAGGAVVHVLAAAAGAWLRGLRQTGPRPGAPYGWELLAAAASGAVGGAALYGAAQAVLAAPAVPKQPLYASLAVPALLAVFWLAVTVFAGLTRRFKSEEDREWWSRAGGQWLLLALAWALLHVLVLQAPIWLLQAPFMERLPGYAAVGGGTLGLGVAVGLWGFWSKNGSRVRQQVQGAAERLGLRVLDLVALAFLVFLALSLSIALSVAVQKCSAGIEREIRAKVEQHTPRFQAQWLEKCTASQPQAACEKKKPRELPAARQAAVAYETVLLHTQPLELLALLGGLAALGAAAAWFVGASAFSLHSMYGNRLVRAYLGATRDPQAAGGEEAPDARRPHWFTGFDPQDNLPLADTWQRPARRRLFHVVNTALNLVAPSGGRLEWQQRKAASFTLSPLHCGSPVLGFAPTREYGKKPKGAVPTGEGFSLGRAMTISGAAAAPNMGYHSSTPVALAMSFFNLRLGWWLPNPGHEHRAAWPLDEPRNSLKYVLTELLGLTTEKRSFVYLSDGGHFENLGLYEMVRRRCRTIVVVDATQDPLYRYADLESSLRKVRIDFGISIDFPHGLPTPASARKTGQHVAVGTVRYSEVDGPVTDGTLIYIKPVLAGDEPLDVACYAQDTLKGSAPFPHQPTSDQFFDEAQFEAYRMLGQHSVRRWLDGRSHWEGMAAPDHRMPAPSHGEAPPGTNAADTARGNAGSLLEHAGTTVSDAVRYTAVALGSAALAVTGTVALRDGGQVQLKEGAQVTVANTPLEIRPASAPSGWPADIIIQQEALSEADRLAVQNLQRELLGLRLQVAALSTHSHPDVLKAAERLAALETHVSRLLNQPISAPDLKEMASAAAALTKAAEALNAVASKLPTAPPKEDTAEAIKALRAALDARLARLEDALRGLRIVTRPGYD